MNESKLIDSFLYESGGVNLLGYDDQFESDGNIGYSAGYGRGSGCGSGYGDRDATGYGCGRGDGTGNNKGNGYGCGCGCGASKIIKKFNILLKL